MNWLAHLFLSENHKEHQLGNILADPLKCKSWCGASTRVQDGIKTHIFIDNFTDSHPLVSKSKALLTPKGHLKGVVLDILYDHYLSLYWDRFCTQDRLHFLDNFRFLALESIESYPKAGQFIIHQVVATKQLESYKSFNGVIDAFKRIDNRLSKKSLAKDNCQRYIPLILDKNDQLQEYFLEFFVQLMQSVKSECNLIDTPHWKTFK